MASVHEMASVHQKQLVDLNVVQLRGILRWYNKSQDKSINVRLPKRLLVRQCEKLKLNAESEYVLTPFESTGYLEDGTFKSTKRFSSHTIKALNQLYEQTIYPSVEECNEFCLLHHDISKKQIKNWFANKRRRSSIQSCVPEA
mmetsp:Transcript_44674/g.87510  ORF Transcript_44674/g.87510 Transcript_44674/m.87510 type:complete len:143 (+) Transcript_44674:83-511(+)|eukprot:CAMPEP_0175091922 /NCGR_PEP_ID=MMETSP0086_2-20121207/2177_1 /TAXON_ID=136419 /ORGANISM="Unknown Unknown, Strain D1" /LENGTH=142 /DNA_ID=CAMNT_0016364729 /DNA_START=119 /DNA_END=547 /DNA_ORIENTATION=+